MARRRAYLDWNATAPVLPDVAEAVARALELGNPSSVHAEGRAARAAIEKARAEVAALVGAEPGQVTFTSGATEAAAMALQPVSTEETLFVGASEHPCIRAGGGFDALRRHVMPVDEAGRFDFAALAEVAGGRARPDLIHVAVQAANNETGVLNDGNAIARLKAQGFTVTCDAVQAAGKLRLDARTLGADFLLLSAHKIGGPKGVGALIARADACGGVRPLLRGGGQERGLRAGTENVAGIVGFGVAARLAQARLPEMERVRTLRDRFERDLRSLAPDVVVFGAQATRLPNTSLFAIPGLRAETAVIAFDLDGVAVSSGSACSSGKVGRNAVLDAMGISSALADGAIRVSLGWTSDEDDINQALDSVRRQLTRVAPRRQSAA
ncbi:MAG TPA: cysteine desulfurase family protein [Beijerinckiaceae bacterium]|nr:cysteine desulfurase family protein [Beijerinckiaceae bacterium]